MIAIPAVDLRDGACVQLVGGSFADERVRLDDPVAVAKRWAECGFRTLHVVDLDAAIHGGSNRSVIDSIIRGSGMSVQVGGGIRTSEHLASLFDAGATRAVVGTRALEDSRWLATQANAYPGRLIVAVDMRGGHIAVDGWTRSLAADLTETLRSLAELPLAGLLVTDVDVEGRLDGPNLSLLEQVVDATTLPIIASGGVASIDDLRALATRGAAGAVIGMALYTERIDARAAAQEFHS